MLDMRLLNKYLHCSRRSSTTKRRDNKVLKVCLKQPRQSRTAVTLKDSEKKPTHLYLSHLNELLMSLFQLLLHFLCNPFLFPDGVRVQQSGLQSTQRASQTSLEANASDVLITERFIQIYYMKTTILY